MKHCLLIFAASLLIAAASYSGEDRQALVLADKKLMELDGSWIYNDPEKAFAEAKKSGKPLLVVMRCIPCHACKIVDEDVAARSEVLQKLMDEFICLRIVQGNNLDLTLYQFDYDMSWAVLFMNADKTIYGRFGSRFEQKNGDVKASLQGLRQTMETVLAAHKAYPANKDALAGKQPKPVSVARPEAFPQLKNYMPQLDYQKDVVKSCVHCHMIRDAERDANRGNLTDKILLPYPGAETLGVTLDPATRSKVLRVAPDSIAAKAGLQAGDELATLDGQPIYAVADINWALHHFDSGALKTEVRRGAESKALTLQLPAGWRFNNDLSWRVSTWNLRRTAFGGMLLDALTAEERAALKLPENTLALRAKHVGQYGEHAVAKNAGVVKGDIVVDFGGLNTAMSESQLIVSILRKFKPGEQLDLTVLRDGQKKTLQLKLP